MNIAVILLILLVGVIVTYLSGNRFASKVAILFSTAAAVFAIAVLLKYGVEGRSYSIGWVSDPMISFSLNADGLGLAMLLLTTCLLPIILLTGSSADIKREKTFYSLVLFMAFAMVGAFLSSDALLYYVFWELSLLPIYFLIVLWGNGEVLKRKKAAFTFFIYTFAGSLFMLAAIIYMYTKVGSFQLEAFYNANLTETEQIWIFVAFFLAYAIKTPIFPFHTWQANAYQKAPAMGTMLLAGLMSKMGVYSIIRWQIPIAPYAAQYLQPIVLALCVIGVIYGAIIALRQDNLKRFFAYSSLSHIGLITAGAYSLTLQGMEGAVALMIAHGLAIVGLFFAADIISKRTETLSISQLGGIKSLAPRFTIAFFSCLLASISLPLSYSFVGELGILFGLYNVNIWWAVLAGCSLFLGAFYVLRMYQQVMLGETAKSIVSFRDLSKSEMFVFVALIGVLLFFGIYSIPVTELIAPSLQEIVTYIK